MSDSPSARSHSSSEARASSEPDGTARAGEPAAQSAANAIADAAKRKLGRGRSLRWPTGRL